MTSNKPMKSFKKLTIAKDTVMPTSLGTATPQPQSGERTAGGMSASEYCSGMTSCSTFYSC